MKLKITFKTPDAVDHALREELGAFAEIDCEEDLIECTARLGKWVRYGESVTIEFDLDTMTANVLEEK